MSLTKVNYIDNSTIITAKNLNDIQDNIIQNAELIKKVAPRNLLDNSDFRNPVNQRGATSYAVKKKYTIDRWYDNTAMATQLTVSIENGYIQLLRSATAGNIIFVQKLEKLLHGKYTFAVCTEHGVTTNVINFAGESKDWPRTDIPGCTWWINFNTAETYPCVRIVNTTAEASALKVYWAVLYEGEYTLDTLPEYQPKGYGAELNECMRYFYRFDCMINGMYYTLNGDITQITGFLFPVEMRIAPSMTIETLKTWTTSGFTAISESQISSKRCTKGGLQYIDLISGVNTKSGLVALTANFSADL